MGITIPRDRDSIKTQKLLSEFERWTDTHECTLDLATGQFDTNSPVTSDTMQDTDAAN